ncbi:hypothetical protein VKT23_012199 [Stygiomarasmius scandens]|uniref:DUF6534 domain-containing protein n=1 Tax=Marasmiellus scandens TaxID=2682957 RepID=A0ABR1J6Q5_9AGAR
MFYVLAITQIFRYFKVYTNDRLIKITVSAALVCDTLTTMAACANSYIYSVVVQGEFTSSTSSEALFAVYLGISNLSTFFFNLPGDTLSLVVQYWPSPIYLISTGISATLVQTFMLNRYWNLTRRKIVTLAIVVMILASLGSVTYLAFMMIFLPNNADRDKVTIAVIIWLTAATVADVFIALALTIYYKSETGVKLPSSKILIRRLSSLALKTGSFTAIYAVVTLIIYFSDPQSNTCLIFAYSIGRIYSLTLLYNLNIRQELQNQDTMIDLDVGSIQRLSLTHPSRENGSRARADEDNISLRFYRATVSQDEETGLEYGNLKSKR